MNKDLLVNGGIKELQNNCYVLTIEFIANRLMFQAYFLRQTRINVFTWTPVLEPQLYCQSLLLPFLGHSREKNCSVAYHDI